MGSANQVRIEIEYPIFRKIKERASLEDVREVLSKIRGSLAEEVLKEREEEWR